MTKKFNVVDLGKVLAISVYDECEYYQNSNRDYYKLCERLNNLYEIKEHHKKEKLNLLHENKELKKEDELFFGKVFDILLKYQDLFNREMADEVLEELGIELTRWFE